MMLLGSVQLLGGAQGLGEGNAACTTVVSSMGVGQYCDLPDGSNIAMWNGTQLVNPAGGPIDAVNAATLVASGWPTQQVSGAAGVANQQATAAGASSGQPWWSMALTAATKGFSAGLQPSAAGAAPSMTPLPAPTPWYMTPIGIGGILGALGLTYYLFKK